MLPLGQASVTQARRNCFCSGTPPGAAEAGWGAQRKSFEPLPRWFRPPRCQLKLSKCPALTKGASDGRAPCDRELPPRERHVWLGGARAPRPEERLGPGGRTRPRMWRRRRRGRSQRAAASRSLMPALPQASSSFLDVTRSALQRPRTGKSRGRPARWGGGGHGNGWGPGGDACATLLTPRVTARPPLTTPAV